MTREVREEPEAWDPGPTIRAARHYARRLDQLFEELIELEASLPRPTHEELQEVRSLKRPLSVSAHLLAVIDAATTALDSAIVGLREGVRKRSLKALEGRWRARKTPPIEDFDLIYDALEYLERDESTQEIRTMRRHP